MSADRSTLQDTGGNDAPDDDTFEVSGILQKALNIENELQGCIAFSGATKNKQDEMRSHVKSLIKLVMEQQVMITHLMGRMSSSGERVPTSYAEMVKTPVKAPRGTARSRSRSRTRKLHNVLVIPKNEQSSVDTRKHIQSKVNPSKVNVKVNSLKNVNKGGIIISTPTAQDIDKLIEEFGKIDEIKDNFEIRKPKLLDPRIIVFNVEVSITKEEFLEGLRTSFKSRFGRNWIVSMDPTAFNEIIKKPKINFNWNRLGFRENVRIIQCLKCASTVTLL
ncbi:hypothetical protein AVEN_154277-1 [Araneus ventricosus]|uniref:Uncharacterized protein n=1 Tax=Araneus ventricosus TaxID=182803 RepID=A0A4Y2V695_ARAVE|nr:hypothetical protein AVEN_154277-1 [Araneus ventricosus]